MKISVILLVLAAPCCCFGVQASWYGDEFAGRPMANGERFNPDRHTVASWDFPLGTWLLLRNGNLQLWVRVSDRGPARQLYRAGRRLDLSREAFRVLSGGSLEAGLIDVWIADKILPLHVTEKSP